jgi:ABC-2 type transport system permease protein
VTDQVIYDRGYRTYEGERTGPSGARRAVYKDGIRRILGLGRKARDKVYPWLMIAIALAMAAIVIGIHWLIGDLAESLSEGVPSYGELFDLYSWIGLLFIAFAGPWLLIPDRTRGVLSVYFSRPLTVDGYLVSKVGAFATVVGAIYLVPQIVLHIGLGLISDDGFLTYMGDNLDVLWKVPVTTLAFVGMHGALALLLSAVIARPGIASAAFLGVLIPGRFIATQISEASFAGARWTSLLAFDHLPRVIRDALFRDTVTYPAEAAGFGGWTAAAVIGAAVVISAVLVRARYRRLA